MIDILASPRTVQKPSSKLPAILFAVLCFVIWDSGYYKKWISDDSRNEPSKQARAALLIKTHTMTSEQKHIANSPVIDEIADERNVLVRVIDSDPGDMTQAPSWVKELFASNQGNAPCLAIINIDGKKVRYDAPSSISEFRNRIGAK